MDAPSDSGIDPSVPCGWSYNPSTWTDRLPLIGLALAGLAIATYLALYQLHVVRSIWEPFFGIGSRKILRESAIARWTGRMGIPDAALGAVAYLLDAVADAVGGRQRWRTMPWIVLLLGLLATGLAGTGILLVICQPVLFDAWCTLCLASAFCSVAMFGGVMDEVLATLQYLRRQSAQGRSPWRVLWGLRPKG